MVSRTDGGSGIKAWYVKTPTTTNAVCAEETYTIGNSGEGWYELYAVDNAGNRSETYRLYYDITLPTLSASVASGGYTNEKVQISRNDNVSGVKEWYVKTPASDYATISEDSYFIGNAGEGWYEFYAVDNAGNRSETYKLYYDITLPTLSASVASGGYTNEKAQVTASDNISGVKR